MNEEFPFYGKLIHDFVAESEHEMSCVVGEKVIVQFHEDGWYTCTNTNGKIGLVPKAFIVKDEDESTSITEDDTKSKSKKKKHKSKSESKKKDKSALKDKKSSKKLSIDSSKKENNNVPSIIKNESQNEPTVNFKNESINDQNNNQGTINNDQSSSNIQQNDSSQLYNIHLSNKTATNSSNNDTNIVQENSEHIEKPSKDVISQRRLTFHDNRPKTSLVKTPPPTFKGGKTPGKFPMPPKKSPNNDGMGKMPLRRETVNLTSSKELEQIALNKDIAPIKKFPVVPKRPDLPKIPPKPNIQPGNPNEKPVIPPKSLSSRSFKPVTNNESRRSTDSIDLSSQSNLYQSKSTDNIRTDTNSQQTSEEEIPQEGNEQKRIYIVNEILTTEKSYVSGLEEAINNYYKPLLEASKREGHENDVKSIFSSIEHILPLNKTLLKSLEERVNKWSPEQTIGDIFLRFAPFLKMYTTHSNNYDQALETLSKLSNFPWFNQIVEFRNKVESVLITPIQRIPRYNLLLTDLLKNTGVSHKDRNDIMKALELMKSVASHVNTSVGIHKNIARLTNAGLGKFLAPHRVFLRDKTISVITPENEKVKKRIIRSDKTEIKKKDYHFLLFNDTLVYISQPLDDNLMPRKEKKGFLSSKGKQSLKRVLWPLYLVWLKDIGLSTGFEVYGPTTTFTMYFSNAEERNSWWGALNEMILKEIRKENSNASDNSPISLIERKGSYSFNEHEEYEGLWRQGIIHGKGIMKCFGVTYEGEFEGGFKTGKGTIKYRTGQVFTGSWKEGKPQGSGTMVYPNSDVYEGEFKDGKRHGKGLFKFNNGSIYDGEWRFDLSHGQGHLKLKNGNEYRGGFAHGRFNGNGVLKYIDGSEYNGCFSNGFRHGKGVLKMKDETYDGEWKHDKRHGYGVHTSESLGVYEGEWKNDMREGKGLMKYKDGETYNGLWGWNRPNGQGVWEYKDGFMLKYDGEFVAGIRSGKGKAYFNDNSIYDGEWAEDLPSGIGKYISSNGTVYEGKWNLGCLESKIVIRKSVDSEDKVMIETLEDSNAYNIISFIPLFDFILPSKHII